MAKLQEAIYTSRGEVEAIQYSVLVHSLALPALGIYI